MNKFVENKKNSIWLMFFGICFSVLYGSLGFEEFSREEAWALGISQIYITSGILLTIFSYLLYKQYLWARWLIILWCPVTIGAGIIYITFLGIKQFDVIEFLFLGLPIILIWFSGFYYKLIYSK